MSIENFSFKKEEGENKLNTEKEVKEYLNTIDIYNLSLDEFLKLPEETYKFAVDEWINNDEHVYNLLLNNLNKLKTLKQQEIILRTVKSIRGTARELIESHLPEISEYKNKEEIVLNVIKHDWEAAGELIESHLPEISEYKNKEEIEFVARLTVNGNPNFNSIKNLDKSKEEILLGAVKNNFAAKELIRSHLPEISEYKNKEEIVLRAVKSIRGTAKELIESHLLEISEYKNKEEIVKICFNRLGISYTPEKITYVVSNLNNICNTFSASELIKYFKLSNIELNFNSKGDIQYFKINNIWDEIDKKQYNKTLSYLSDNNRKKEYQDWLEKEISNMDEDEQQIFFGKTGLLKKYNEKSIIANYISVDNYHMALDCFNEKNFSKFKIQDIVQLLNNTLPSANPNDFGKDKYEIFKTLLNDFGSDKFNQNFVDKYLDDAELDSLNKSKNRNKELQKIVSKKFREKELFNNVLRLYKETRLLASFSKEDYQKLEELKNNRQEKVYNYFIYLLEHETASIDALRSLLSNPDVFFSRECSYDQLDINKYINPTNWTKIGDSRIDVSINLTLEDIRNFFMNGKLDTIVPLQAFKKEYEAKLTNQAKEEIAKNHNQQIKLIDNSLNRYFSNEIETGGDVSKIEKVAIFNSILDKMITMHFDKGGLLNFFQKVDKQICDVLKKVSIEKEKEYIELMNRYKENINDSNSNNEQAKELINFVLDNVNLTTSYLLKNGARLKDEFLDDSNNNRIRKILETKNSTKFSIKAIKYLEKLGKESNDAINQKAKEFIDQLKEKLKEKYKVDFSSKVILKAEILMPSNPERPTVGNNTNSCDGFGDGKRTQYDFNPTCSQLAISFIEKLANKKERTVVVTQSLLTFNTDTSDKEIIQKIVHNKSGFDDLKNTLGKNFLEKYYKKSKKILSCDNIEVNNNFKGKILFNNATVGKIYRDFIITLLKNNPQLEQSKFIVGSTYNDVNVIKDLRAKDEPNTFLLSSLLPYSDNMQSHCNIVETGLKNNKKEQEIENKKAGIREISAMDTFPVAFLEEQIYTESNADNLVEGITQIQNILIGSSYACLKHNIANLNKGYFNKKGILKGYLLAYPVKNTDTNDISIYVHDLAIDKKSKMAGGKLMIDFFKTIKLVIEKLKKETGQDKVTIKMASKKDTAYPIIKAGVEKYGFKIIKDKDLGGGMMEMEIG